MTLLDEYLDVVEAHAREMVAQRSITHPPQLRISMAVQRTHIERITSLHAQLLASGCALTELDAACIERCEPILGKTFRRS